MLVVVDTQTAVTLACWPWRAFQQDLMPINVDFLLLCNVSTTFCLRSLTFRPEPICTVLLLTMNSNDLLILTTWSGLVRLQCFNPMVKEVPFCWVSIISHSQHWCIKFILVLNHYVVTFWMLNVNIICNIIHCSFNKWAWSALCNWPCALYWWCLLHPAF